MVTIQAESRLPDKKLNQQLRRSGWIPAILYGEESGTMSIQVKEADLEHVLRTHPINKPLSLQVMGKSYNVMVYELQRHPVQGKLLHADFKQINRNEKVHTSVPVVVTGDPAYGLVAVLHHTIDVSCLPDDIPESFVADVEGLEVGDAVTVQDLAISDNIEITLDQLEPVVKILAPQVAPEAAEGAAEENQGEEGKDTSA